MFKFTIEAGIKGKLGRAGRLTTAHGVIETPSFVVVGTKATVKTLSPEMVKSLGAQVVLANTYHLYLEPGHEIIDRAGGFAKFMNWNGPSMTDSGGFQVFSLGAAFGTSVGKISKSSDENSDVDVEGLSVAKLAKVDEEGVTFKSVIDGSTHRFTPEYSMEIEHALGADIMFAFDECTSPHAPYDYQKEAMARTHRWAKRSLEYHGAHNKKDQALFGIVQGGRFEDLRKESAKVIGAMDFPGFGIGGSFDKEDMGTAVKWVNESLDPSRPRHLLGIGEPLDLFMGVENGVDLFDCVAPTRMARHGSLFTNDGRINIRNARFVEDFSPIDGECGCYTCSNYSAAYLSHLFRANEMFGATLASVHNLHFIVHLVDDIRASIHAGTYEALKDRCITRYYKK